MKVRKNRIYAIFIFYLFFTIIIAPSYAQDIVPQENLQELWNIDDGVNIIKIGGSVNDPTIISSGKNIIKTGYWSYTNDQDYENFPAIYISIIKKVPAEQTLKNENKTDTHRRRSLSSRSASSNVKWVRKRVQENISPIILKYARAYNISPYIIRAIIEVESSFNPQAISTSGACGLMQLKPSTAYEMGIYDYWDYEKNIEAGTKYLRLMLDMFGNLSTALAGYNQGPGAVQRAGGNPPNRAAIRYIWKIYQALEKQN